MSYSPLVERHFRQPQHQGPLLGAEALCVQRGDLASGAVVKLWGRVTREGRWQLSFQAYGCPHTIACASYVCAQWQDVPLARLGEVQVPSLMQQLEIPMGKRHCAALLAEACAQLSAQVQ